MNKKQLIIRADGGPEIGMGHIVRCLALAEMSGLKNISFACQKEKSGYLEQTITEAGFKYIDLPVEQDFIQDIKNLISLITKEDIVVFDHYQLKTEHQKLIKENGNKLICIDDLHNCHFVADVIINHAVGGIESKYSKEQYTQLYCGPQYALLRKPFREVISNPKKQDSLFICFGAADPENYTLKYLELIKGNKNFPMVQVLVGSVNKNYNSLKEYCKQYNYDFLTNLSAEELCQTLQESKYAIVAASGIALEAMACGCLILPVLSAENQREFFSFLQGTNLTAEITPSSFISYKLDIRKNTLDFYNKLFVQ